MISLWMVGKSCTTKRMIAINNGINHLSVQDFPTIHSRIGMIAGWLILYLFTIGILARPGSWRTYHGFHGFPLWCWEYLIHPNLGISHFNTFRPWFSWNLGLPSVVITLTPPDPQETGKFPVGDRACSFGCMFLATMLHGAFWPAEGLGVDVQDAADDDGDHLRFYSTL